MMILLLIEEEKGMKCVLHVSGHARKGVEVDSIQVV